jgi:hypothetical protein
VGLGFRAAMDEEGVQKKEENRRRRQDMKDKICDYEWCGDSKESPGAV